MARRKIDKAAAERAAAMSDDELPDLTPQQMLFVEGLLEGKTATDAYKAAYNTSAANTVIWAEASKLRNNPKVASWLSAARKAHLGTAVVTIESHQRELERIKELAIESGNLGAAAQCEQLRGKVAGHYVDKFEDVTPSEPAKLLRDMAKMFPEILPAIAQRVAQPVPIKLEPIEANADPAEDEDNQ